MADKRTSDDLEEGTSKRARHEPEATGGEENSASLLDSGAAADSVQDGHVAEGSNGHSDGVNKGEGLSRILAKLLNNPGSEQASAGAEAASEVRSDNIFFVYRFSRQNLQQFKWLISPS